MELEIEAKFYPVNKPRLRKQLTGLGAKIEQDEILMRRAVYSQHKNPQIQGTYVRVRDEGNKITLSLKVNAKATGKINDQKELQVIVDGFDKTKQLLKYAGLTLTGYQENLRECWRLYNSEIVIDTWPGLQSYVEIESPTIKELKRVFKELDLVWGKRKIVSTDEIYAQTYNITKKKALDMLEHCTFKKNPFTNLA